MIDDFTQAELAAEEWRPVVGFEHDFQVSNLGRVRRIYAGGRDGWRILAQQRHGSANSYLVVNLSREGARAIGRRHKPGDHKPGTRFYRKVHVLVLEAFVGPRPSGMQVCHGPGGSFNNRVSNLRWDTWEANCADMVAMGTRKGENNGRAKLNVAKVIALRQRIKAEGYKAEVIESLATEYGVDPNMIRYAATGRYWAHVTEEAPVVRKVA